MQKAVDSSKKKSPKRKKWILLGIFISLAILLLGGFLTLQTSKFRAYVISKIDQRLQKDFDLSLSAKSLELNLFRLSASLEELKISPLVPEGSILQSFGAQRVHINLSSKTLLGKGIHIQKFHVTKPQLRLSKTKRMPPSTKEVRPVSSKPLSLRVDDFFLDKGQIDYQDREFPITAFITDISINIRFLERDAVHNGTLTARSGEFNILESQFSLDKFFAELTVDDHSIQITRFICETAPFGVSASGKIQDYRENPNFLLSIEGTLRMDFLNNISKTDHNFSGILSFATSVNGTGSDLRFDGHLQAKDILVADIPLKNLGMDFQGNRTRIALSNVVIEDSSGSMNGQMVLSLLEKGESSAEFQWASLRLSALENWKPELSLLSSTRTSGSISAKWGERTLDSLEAKGEVKLGSVQKPLSASKEQIDIEGNVTFHAKNGILTIFPSTIRLNQTTLAASGSLSSSLQFKLSYQLKSKELKDTERFLSQLRIQTSRPGSKALSLPQIDGQLSLNGEVSGSFEQPEATLKITGRDIILNAHEVGNVDAELTYAKRTVNVISLSIGEDQREITMDGTISIDPFEKSFIPSASLRLKATDLDIAPFSSLIQEKYSVQGSLSGEVVLSGKLSDPAMQFFWALNNFVVNDEDFSSIKIRGQYLKQKLTLEEFGITKSEGVLGGSLGLDLSARTFDIDCDGRSIDLSSFRILNTGEKTIQGTARIRVKGSGTVENPVFSLELSMESIHAQSVWVGSLVLEAVSNGRIVEIRMETPLGQTSLTAKLTLEDPYLMEGRLKTESIDIWHALRSVLEPLPSPITSQLSATADFVIPLRDWTSAIFSMNLQKGSFRYKDFTIQTSQPIHAKIQNRTLIVEDFAIQGPQTEFAISGSLPLIDKPTGNIQITGSINLRLLEALFPGTEASGLLEIKGSLSGSLSEPILNASMAMENGQYVSPLFPLNFQNISFQSEIRENVFHLDHLFIGVGEGNISARGTIFLPPLMPGKTLIEPLTQSPDMNEIVVSLNELNLEPFTETLSDILEAQFRGIIDGSIRLHGDFFSISRIKMDGELKRLELSLDEFKMSNEDKILFGANDGVIRLSPFRLSGGRSFFQAEGELNLNPEARIDAHLSASLDSAVLSPFIEDAVLGGNLTFDLDLQGSLTSPEINGLGRISEGFFQMEEPPVLATDFNGTLEFPDSETISLFLEGIINGGSINIKGKIGHRSFAIATTRFEARATGIQLNYPEGFQAISDGTITLEKKENAWLLGGDIKINQSYYNAEIYPGSELVNTLQRHRRALRSDIPPSIRSLNLNINLTTADAFIIENNLADLELDANIRISGTVFDPRLSGFVRSGQTGQIVFGNREYEVERANLDFQDNDPLEGQLSITAHTQISHTQLRYGYEDVKVTLTITGTITNLQIGLNSSPSRSEIELASLLITGYGTESLRADAASVIGNQLMLYFLTPIASPFTNIVKDFLRAEMVTIEPINIASEEDPGARFTFRKGLIRALYLIYSIDISNTQKQAWILDYNIIKNFTLQSYAKDDGSYGGSFSHRFFLGSSSAGKLANIPIRNNQLIIKDIRFEGDPIISKSDLKHMSRSLKTGSVFSYKDLRKTINTLETFYKANDYLNAVIKPTLQKENSDSITITFNISPDSPAAVAFGGDALSKKLRREVINRWNGRLPEEMSISQAKKQILRDLNGKSHLEAQVSNEKIVGSDKSVYAFSVSLGPKYRIRNFTIDGQSAISPETIKAAVSGIPKAKGKGLWALLSDFKRAKLRIEGLYADNGYQNARINRPQVHFDRDKKVVNVILPIEQGAQSRISALRVTGNSVFTSLELRNAMSLKEGGIFSPTYLATDTNMLYSLYRSSGFHDVQINVQTISGSSEASLDLLYTIQEGEIHTISSIEVRGNQRTSEHVIRRELAFKEGDILRIEDLITSQKNLYDLMVFRTVNIQREDKEGQRERPKILVEVQEDPRFAVSYGLRYNSEEKLEGFGQLDVINILGGGRNGLFFYRQNDRQKDFRFSLKDPYLFGKRFNTLYSFFYTEETFFDFKEEVWGVSIQQQLQVSRYSSFSYLFRINNTHSYTFDLDNPYPRDLTYFLPEFQVFWIRDTRTSLLNAKNGSFLSLSLTYSPEFLNTTTKYIKFFGQYSLYVPISNRFVWASNYRIGLADAFDEVLAPRSRRFFAGGANSIRGFERDTVGPYIPILDLYIGGEALFVMNQELRFPLYKWLEGVAFFDMGNVYENLGDFNPVDVRTSAGFGLRLNLPAIFLRLDYGINLAPREYEKKTVIYFSIGQAF